MSEDKENQKNLQPLEEDDTMSAIIERIRPCTISESIIQSCKEVKLMREGKLPKRSWDNFAKEMRQTIEEDEKK